MRNPKRAAGKRGPLNLRMRYRGGSPIPMGHRWWRKVRVLRAAGHTPVSQSWRQFGFGSSGSTSRKVPALSCHSFECQRTSQRLPRRASGRDRTLAAGAVLGSASRRPRGYWPDEAPGRRLAARRMRACSTKRWKSISRTFRRTLSRKRQPKPVIRSSGHLSIARDAHRQDEAGALHLRREQNQGS